MSLEYNGMSQIMSRTNRERILLSAKVPGSEKAVNLKYNGVNKTIDLR